MKERRFMVRNVHPHEIPLVIGETNTGVTPIAILNGSFEKNGRQISTVLTRKNIISRDDPDFMTELKGLIHYLRTDYANGLLFGSAEMQKVCAECGEPFSLKAKNRSAYGFETHTAKFSFFLKCMPDSENGSFVINCYDRLSLISAGLAPADGGI